MKNFAIVGYPLGHSLSPALHKRLWEIAPFGDCNYEVMELPPAKLKFKITRKKLLKLSGFNVTIPHKTGIIPLLDGLDDAASSIGSVNTVQNKGGKLYGYNTDIFGLCIALKMYNMPITGDVLMYGCGGAARSAAAAVLNSGGKLTVAARDIVKAKEFADSFKGFNPKPGIKSGIKIDVIPQEEIRACETIINCTPAGMYKPDSDAYKTECAVPDEVIRASSHIYDMVYNPKMTALVKKALDYGKNAQTGMAMLIFQAVFAQQIWRDDFTFAEKSLQRALLPLLLTNFPLSFDISRNFPIFFNFHLTKL
jgi:shikimate dehydrogenase